MTPRRRFSPSTTSYIGATKPFSIVLKSPIPWTTSSDTSTTKKPTTATSAAATATAHTTNTTGSNTKFFLWTWENPHVSWFWSPKWTWWGRLIAGACYITTMRWPCRWHSTPTIADTWRHWTHTPGNAWNHILTMLVDVRTQASCYTNKLCIYTS